MILWKRTSLKNRGNVCGCRKLLGLLSIVTDAWPGVTIRADKRGKERKSTLPGPIQYDANVLFFLKKKLNFLKKVERNQEGIQKNNLRKRAKPNIAKSNPRSDAKKMMPKEA